MTDNLFRNLTVTALAAFALSACHKGDTSKTLLTAPLDNAAWASSQWISAKDAPVITGSVEDGTRSADGSSWFLSTVKNRGRVVKAVWMTTGLGVYDLFVNGKAVGDEVLKPGFTHSGKTKRAFTYDITRLMDTHRNAENTLAAQSTPGWWADKIITPAGHEGMVGRKCAFRGVLMLTYADGTTQTCGTDTLHWQAGTAGPVTHASIFDGEDYDARLLPGYDTPEKLTAPEQNTEFGGDILPTDGAEVYLRRDLALKPVKAYVWEHAEGATDDAYGKVAVTRVFADGEDMVVRPGEKLVVDFGQNCAAVPMFTFSAEEGTTLTCLVGELLNDGNGAKSRGMDGPEGSLHRLNLRVPDTGMRLTYTFGQGGQPVEFCPTHTFFGYRFVSVTATDEVRIKRLRSVPVSSISPQLETGTLATGNLLINRLVANTVWGQRSNYLSVPTDCPQRNERLGWTADTQVFSETGTFFADTRRFFHKWMRDMRDTQSATGAFPGVAPLAQYGCYEHDMMRLGWNDAGVIVPWVVWKQFDDKLIVDENWVAMERLMNHMDSTRYDHTALAAENGNYQWADWLSYEPLESCGGGIYGEDGSIKPEAINYWCYLGACYWAIDAGMMRDMAQATGRDARRYADMQLRARQYIKERFMRGDGTFKDSTLNTMQTPALFALKNNLVEGEAKAAMIARLRQNFKDHGDCLQTGFLGTSILMPTLTDNGMSDIAYTLLLQRKNPSWLYSVDNGATTVWERWNSYMLDKGMGPQGMNSFNHYAYGVVCEWLWKTAAGIAADTAQPGFKHIIMRPVPDRRLGFVKASYRSAAGLIKSYWRYEGDKWIWTFTIPQGSTASVTLPGESETHLYKAGSYTIER